MPLDRLITVRQYRGGYRLPNGEYFQPPPRVKRIYATLIANPDTSLPEQGARREDAERTWRIRWNSEFNVVSVSQIRVEDGTVDDAGHAVEWQVKTIKEHAGRDGDIRRRWMDIYAVWSG